MYEEKYLFVFDKHKQLPSKSQPNSVEQSSIKHTVFSKNLALLQKYGIHIFYELELYPSPKIVPWSMILDTLDQAIRIQKLDSPL